MRVLLLDEGFASGALTAIGLHAAGCDVDVVAAIGGRASCAATDGKWSFAPRVNSGSFEDVVERLRRDARYDVVYPTTEPLQQFLWTRASGWPALVLPTEDAQRPAPFADKPSMSALAEASGVDVPDQIDGVSAANIDETIRELGLPIVIKGAVGRGGQTTFIASSAAEARDALRRIEKRGTQAFAQQYIDGRTFLVGGVFHRGTPLRLYAGEKRIQFPRRIGPAAVLLSCHEDGLLQSATRVFGAARLTGIGSADFIRGPDGRFYFLELNPRPWGSIGAARDAGVDLFEPLVKLWRGESPGPRLGFAAGVRSPVVPIALASLEAWAAGDAWRALGTASLAVASGRISPGLAVHLAERAIRVAWNWNRSPDRDPSLRSR
jgi:hypothetical protein